MDSANYFKIAHDSFKTHASMATSFGMSGSDRSPSSRLACNLGQSVLKSGQHVVRYIMVTGSFVIIMSRTSGVA